MSTLAYCLERRKAERKAFVRVLQAVPQEGRDYRPPGDAKARSAADLAWTIAAEEAALAVLLDTGSVDWKETPAPATNAEIVSRYEASASAVDEKLAKLDSAGWDRNGTFMMGGVPVWEDKISGFAWGFLFDAIHHRGQLSTYLRPMGSKVPSIYGPSADDSGQ